MGAQGQSRDCPNANFAHNRYYAYHTHGNGEELYISFQEIKETFSQGGSTRLANVLPQQQTVLCQPTMRYNLRINDCCTWISSVGEPCQL